MKNLKQLFLLLSLLFGTQLSAQQIKLGHINSVELLSLMPETKTADAELKKHNEQLGTQLKTMTAEYQNKIQDYQSKESLMADAIKQSKLKEISDLEARIQDFQESGQSSLQKKKEELYAPILKKAQDAITAVAKENGYTYIFDISMGTVLYAMESHDATALVKAKLGLSDVKSPTPSPAPGIGEPAGKTK